MRLNIRLNSEPRNQSGFATAWMLIFALIIILTGAIFFTFGTAIVQRQQLVAAADRAAIAGANTIDEQELIDSDGENVYLNQDSTHGDLAQEVCISVIANEKTKRSGSSISIGESSCTVSDTEIEVTVVGNVSWGAFASLMGVESTKFTAKSRAQPTCSGGAC